MPVRLRNGTRTVRAATGTRAARRPCREDPGRQPPGAGAGAGAGAGGAPAPSLPPSLPPLRLPGRLRTLKNSAEEPPNSAPTPGASADGVRGAWSGRPTRPASVGSSGTAASHPPQAFPLDRSGRSFLRSVGRSVRPSVLPSVTAAARACWSTRAGGHTPLLVLQVQPRARRSGADAPAPPARSRQRRRPAGSPARATRPNRVPRGTRKGRTI